MDKIEKLHFQQSPCMNVIYFSTIYYSLTLYSDVVLHSDVELHSIRIYAL